MKHLSHIGIAVLAFAPISVANAVPDVCDDGGGYRVGRHVAGNPDGGTVFRPEAEADYLGRSVTAGDFNGDGLPDIAIGANGVDTNGNLSGAVYVFFSTSPATTNAETLASTADVILYGQAFYDRSGWTVTSAGDLDDDGLDDLVIGSLPSAGASGGAGLVHIVHGASLSDGRTRIDLATESDARLFGEFPDEEFGTVVNRIGDVNGDGFADIIVGAPKASRRHFNGGSAYLFFGPFAGDYFAGVDNAYRFDSARPTASFGAAFIGMGDMDGDGRDDFAIGSPRDDTAASTAGAVYIFQGNWFATATGDPQLGPRVVVADNAPIAVYGRQGMWCGSSISPAPELTGDGIQDLWIGCKRAGSFREGVVYLVYGYGGDVTGRYSIVDVASVSIWGHGADATAGTSIAGGDFDGDGYVDVLIGGERAEGQVVGSGAAWIEYGPFAPNTTRSLLQFDARFEGTQFGEMVGSSVVAADIDGDGYDDAIIAAWKSSRFANNAGFVTVFRGGADTSDLVTWYRDADDDGVGNLADTTLACDDEPPVGYVRLAGDCNDTDPRYFPGAVETCGDPDYNCDGYSGPTDNDGDGYTACGGDCNDGNPNVNPGRNEVCGNGIDDNCDGLIDDSTSVDASIYYVDVDGDGYGSTLIVSCTRPVVSAALVFVGGDCNDNDMFVNPGAAEVCDDGVDNDCNGQVDDALAVDALTFWQDVDGDGYGDPASPIRACTPPASAVSNRGDCDDASPLVSPAATETCDYKDNDCSGMNYLGGFVNAVQRRYATYLGEGRDNELRGAGFLADQDFDGDDEAIFVSAKYAVRATNGGAVYIARGNQVGGGFDLANRRADGSADWNVRIEGTRASTTPDFGAGIARGDFNGDGVADLAIGAPGVSAPNGKQGAVYVFYGPLSDGVFTTEEADLILRGEASGHQFGNRAAMGDLDGDGYDDLIVSSPTFTGPAPSGKPNQGKLYVIYGRPSLFGNHRADTVADAHVVGVENNARLASAIAVGDFNGDGRTDFVAGSNTFGSGYGASWFFLGTGARRTGELVHSASIGAPSNTSTNFSVTVTRVGDVNADGFADLFFGTNNSHGYLWLGRATIPASGQIQNFAAARFEWDIGTSAGQTSARLGDINGDGYDDFWVGAHNKGYDNQGAVGAGFLLYGRNDFSPYVTGTNKTFRLERVESFGRIDTSGELYDGRPIVRSAANMNTLEGAVVRGPVQPGSIGAGFGIAVGGGDFDGDGVPDFMVGAPNTNRYETETRNGQVYMFLGGRYGVDVRVNDGSQQAWYWDNDADGWTTLETFVACGMHRPIDFTKATPTPRGWDTPTNPIDCDDFNPRRYPGAPESPNPAEDLDCDGYGLPNVLPVLALNLQPRPAYGTSTLDANVTVTDNDPITTPITLHYQWYRGGVPPSASAVEIFGGTTRTLAPSNFVSGETIGVCVRADDQRAYTAWVCDQLTINNSPPRLSTCSITPATPGVGTALQGNHSGLVDDDAGDAPFLSVRYQWRYEQFPGWFDIPSQTGTTLASCVDRRQPTAQPWDCSKGSRVGLRCTPFDGQIVGQYVDATPVTIVNTPPRVDNCQISPAIARTRDELDASVLSLASDPDIEAVTISYEWLINGFASGYTGPRLPATATQHFDQIQVRCRATDASGDHSPVVTSAPIIIQNTPPTAVTINLLPDFPRSNEDLYVTITSPSTDEDGDAITYLYYWQRNGMSFYETNPSTISTVLERDTRKGDTWAVTVTPTDGYANGGSSTDSVLILNTPPTLVAASMQPASPRSDEPIEAIPVGFDDHDGDADFSEFQWYVNDFAVSAANTGRDRILAREVARRGDRVRVQITACDGEACNASATGRKLSSEVIVRNTPPYAATLQPISPLVAGEFVDLSCAFTADGVSTDFDVDKGDQVSYKVEWIRFRPNNPYTDPNGAGVFSVIKTTVGIADGIAGDYISTTVGTAYELPFTQTAYADRIKCVITPYDGFEEGPTVETPERIIIDDEAPAAPELDAIERYRNGTSVTLTGRCESSSFANCNTMIYTCTPDVGSPVTGSSSSWCTGAEGSATYSIPVTLTRGRTYTCETKCEDYPGNESLPSNTRATTVCDPYDQYELLGLGNSQAGAVNSDDTIWGALDDSNTGSISIVGNIIGQGIEFSDTFDWYRIRTLDYLSADNAAGLDRYNFRIEMDQGRSQYDITVYRQTGAALPTDPQCPLTLYYKDYNFFNYDRLDHPITDRPWHLLPADRQQCNSNTVAYNSCTDYTSNYFVRVRRNTGDDCTNYRLQVTNGSASFPTP